MIKNDNQNDDFEINIEENVLSHHDQQYYKLKLIVLGDSGVGKTNIIKKYINDEFSTDTKATVGVEFFYKTFKINNDIIKLEIWDTAGQERYKSITSAYYRGSRGALIVYDITRVSTFESIERWIAEINEKVTGSLKMLVIGNKVDLEEERKVSIEEALDKAQSLNVPLLETSALESTNIDKAFKLLLKEMYKEFKNQQNIEKKENKSKSEGLSLDVNNKKKKSRCC